MFVRQHEPAGRRSCVERLVVQAIRGVAHDEEARPRAVDGVLLGRADHDDLAVGLDRHRPRDAAVAPERVLEDEAAAERAAERRCPDRRSS
jgi:hypothetical protein